MFEAKFGRILKTKVTYDGERLTIDKKSIPLDDIQCIYRRPFSLMNNQFASIYISTDGKNIDKPDPFNFKYIEHTKKQATYIDDLLNLLDKNVINQDNTNPIKRLSKLQEYAEEVLGDNHERLILEVLNDTDPYNSLKVITFHHDDKGNALVESSTAEGFKSQYSIVETVVTNSIDTEKKKKWLGRAIVGNMILPGAGAIVGAMTAKEKEIIKKDNSTAMIVLRKIEDQSIRRIVVKVNQKNERLIKYLPTVEQKDVPTPLIVAEKSNIDLLKEYKELLDLEIISKDEFDAKKKELLN
ncbi:SHOCT domain-containing protein [Marinilactibacillus sp. Marseille-P9653]|uniref:SHOCT domain-containing protein n=1 Tax=Marinilactibacillus sp. Marseille-P9653 TaxID=2866583 RepID=UPI001CE3BC60|nr:SHOCT domain-containing protein [Marinilactibacillus sp. Marseille-P9653]